MASQTEENKEPSDPDYLALQVDKLGEVNESLHREDARDQTVQKIQNIIHDQFSFEIELKEKEVTCINRKVHEARNQLDRLRACVLAGYYGYGKVNEGLRRECLKKSKTRPGRPRSTDSCLNDVMKWTQSLPSHLKEHPKEESPCCLSNDPEDDLGTLGITNEDTTPQSTFSSYDDHVNSAFVPTASSLLTETVHTSKTVTESESRFYVKRRVIVGNTSKYILPEHRETNDRSTHKWMVYVRGPKDNTELQEFISKVWFLLHPSYQPNDLVEVCKPPFQVTRRGWGEFPVRVQLHFVESKNKRVDIIHHLKLDKTYTGLQTLGAETHVDIELDRRNFDGKNSQNFANLLQPEATGRKQEFEEETQDRTPATIDSNSNDLSLLHKLDHDGLNDHSYSVPVTKQDKIPCDDGLKYPTPPTSVPGSRCSTPEITKESLVSTMTYESEVIIQESVEQCPLVNPDFNVTVSPYCAKSLNQYLGWTIGKRLAVEWQRSLAVKKHVFSHHSISGFSTKDIMNYCRLHGYTPMSATSMEGKNLCKMCGEERSVEEDSENEFPQSNLVHEHCNLKENIPGSLTSADKFFNIMETSNSLLPEPDIQMLDDPEPSDIDVIGEPEEQSTRHLLSPRLLFLQSDDTLEWVQETAAQVNVHLQGTNIDGVRAPVTTAMLYKACGLLMEDILRKANRFTWKTPSRIPKAKCILPIHVKKALQVIPHCDFLTNKYLGVELTQSGDD